MADQVPLVTVNGQMERLAAGDRLATGATVTTSFSVAQRTFTPASPGDSTSVGAADQAILVITSTYASGVLLPTPVGAGGRRLTVKDKSFNSGRYPITVSTAAALIDGSATFRIAINAQSVDFISDGANWFAT